MSHYCLSCLPVQVQRIFQLAAYKAKREVLTGASVSCVELANEFSSKVAISSGEQISKDYAYTAMAVYDRILKDDTCRSIILSVPLSHIDMPGNIPYTQSHRVFPAFRQAEEEFGKKTPWDSVSKLEWVFKKAGSSTTARRKIIWQLAAVSDLVRHRMVTPGELSISGLSGKGRGGRGVLDLVLFKLDLLDELIVTVVDQVKLSSEVKSTIRSIFENHTAYRSHVGDNADMMWMSSLPSSARDFVRLVSAPCLRNSVRQLRSSHCVHAIVTPVCPARRVRTSFSR